MRLVLKEGKMHSHSAAFKGMVGRATQLACAALFLCWMPHAYAACSRLIVAADPAYPPLHWYDGSALQGASIEIAKRVLDDLKIPYEVRYVGPLPRVLVKAERGEVDMVATLKKTPERETFLSYPKTAAFSNPVAVFVARKHSFTFRDRRDLVGLRGGITNGNLFGDGLDEYLREHLSFEEANSAERNFDKLGLARIDYFLTGYYAGMAYLSKRGEEDTFEALTPYVAATENYLALTRNGNCLDKLDAIDARLAVLKKSGVIDGLIRQSMRNWKARPTVVD
jgi:polar amino acid transport system substrate-binding protein